MKVKHCGSDERIQVHRLWEHTARLHTVECYISRLCFRHVLFLLQRRLSASPVHGSIQKYQVRFGECLKNYHYFFVSFLLISFIGFTAFLFSPIVSPVSFFLVRCLFQILHLINLFHPTSYCFLFSYALSLLLSTSRWQNCPSLLPSQSHLLWSVSSLCFNPI